MRVPEWSQTLRWRLIWPSIAINLIAVAVTAWIAFYFLRQSLARHLKARGEIVSHAVNYAAESVASVESLQRFVLSLGAEQDVNLIVVVGYHRPEVLACTRKEFNGAPLDRLPWPEAIPALQKAMNQGQPSTQTVDDIAEFQIAAPLIFSETQRPGSGGRAGAVLVRLTEVPGNAEIARNVWTGASLFILVLLGTNALILFLIQRRALYPLQLINNTLSKHCEGETTARVPVIARDEIGAVARAMNNMFDRREEMEKEAIKRADALSEVNRLLSESEERFRVAAENATDVIYDWNVLTGEVSWHHDLQTALGYTLEEFPSTMDAWLSVVHPEDRERVESVTKRSTETGAPFDMEYRMISKDGSVSHWRDRGRTIRDPAGSTARMVGVLINVTAERLAAQKLYDAKEAAEAASRAKDDFLATLSHELRTPLNPVLMLAGELERSPDVPRELRENFAMIRHNVELEARLIDDLLDLTRITRGKFHLKQEPVDLNAVLRRAVETVRAMIEARGLTLDMELAAPDHLVNGDSVRLQQVFWNVLKNAAKFTAPGGHIGIRSWAVDGSVRIAITDTGLGIAPENLERIFDAFEQLHEAVPHRFGGLGLGLAISRKLIEAHGGAIWAESTGMGRGATIHIQLPLLSAAQPQHPAETTPPAAAQPSPAAALCILLVEDHEETRTILEKLLRRRGHQVFGAGDVATARELAQQHDFDLVISDIGLPDGNGYDLMAELHRTHPGLFGIALSGFGMEQDIERSRKSGFFVHLTKPVDMQVLERTIANVAQQEVS